MLTRRKRGGFPGIGDVLQDRFEIQREIGRGAHAVVFEAANLLTRKVVALKCPKRLAFELVLHEARAAALTAHPFLIDVYDVGEDLGVFFLIMECWAVPTLQTQMRRSVMSIQTWLSVFSQLLEAVHALHGSGLAHCDLKPANVLTSVGEDGQVRTKLVDFGSAKFLDVAAASSRIRHLGSALYGAPEQLVENANVDHRADIYALGMMLHGALGACSRRREDAEGCRRLHGAALRATAADPRKRPQSISDLRADLGEALSASYQEKRILKAG